MDANNNDFKKQILSDIGERKFLELIAKYVAPSELPFDDDATAILTEPNMMLIINVDMLVKSTDVLPGMSAQQIGEKAVTMSISDIIAKGAKPEYCLISMALPRDLEVAYAQNIFLGIKSSCDYYKCKFIGGDLNESSDIIIDAITVGKCRRSQLISRRGVKEGYYLYVSDLFGLTTLGFKMLLEQFELPNKFHSAQREILHAVYRPKARIDYLPLLHSGLVKASMDSSDGLGRSIRDLIKINKIGFTLESVPIHPIAKEVAACLKLNPLELVLRGGEEFALLMAVSPEQHIEFENLANDLKLKVFKIGTFTKRIKGLHIVDRAFINYSPPINGYEHFH